MNMSNPQLYFVVRNRRNVEKISRPRRRKWYEDRGTQTAGSRSEAGVAIVCTRVTIYSDGLGASLRQELQFLVLRVTIVLQELR